MTTYLFFLLATKQQRSRFANLLLHNHKWRADELAKIFIVRHFNFWQRLGLAAIPIATFLLVTAILVATFLVALNSIAHPYAQ